MRILPFALFLSLSLAGCASPPEGFTLALQLTGIRLAAVDNVRIVLTPAAEGGTMPRFTMPAVGSFEDGGVRLSVDSTDGQLVILISGDYFRAHAVPTGDGDLDPRLSLELWSDDTTMRAGPRINGVVVAAGFEVATADAFLSAWPLPLGTTYTLTLPCTAGREMECRPPAP